MNRIIAVIAVALLGAILGILAIGTAAFIYLLNNPLIR